MFETEGAAAILEPARALALLFFLPLFALVLARTRYAARAAIVSSGALVALAGLFAFRLATLPPGRVLGQSVQPVARIGQLDLSFELALDAASATLFALGTVLGLAAVLQAIWTRAHARLPWIQLLTAAMVLVVAGDSLVLVGAGLALSSIAAWALSRCALRMPLGAMFASDAAFSLGVALLFWALGGAFGASGYVPDAQPRFAVVQTTNASAPSGGARVAMTTYVGARVVAEDGPPLPGEPLRSPFDVELDPGTYSFRVQAGVTAEDAVISHVTLAAGRAHVLMPFGPTTSVRNLADQARVARPSLTGDRSLRATLSTKMLFGVRAGAWIALLLVLAPLFRLGRVASGGALVLEALIPVALAVRLAPVVEGGPVLAWLASVVAVVLAARAAASSAPREALGGVLAANVALAVASTQSGEVGAAIVIAASALAGACAADAALEGGEARWLGVACAAMTGLVPAAGVSTGLAAAVASALAPGNPLGLARASSSLLASALASFASFAVHDAHLARADAKPAPALRSLAAVLGLVALQVGVVLGAGTSPFGGAVAPLVGRIAHGAASLEAAPRVAGMAFAATWIVALGGASLARRRDLELGLLSLPSRMAVRAATAAGDAFGFFARSVRVLDRDVVEDAGAALAAAMLRVGGAVRRLDARASSDAWERLGSATARRLGPRSPTRGLLVMVALVGLVVLSLLILGR